MKILTNLFFSLLLITSASCQEARIVKVTVIEEDGTPVKNANTTVIYLGYGKGGKTEKIGLTNALGVFVAKGTSSGRMSVRVEKEGYYMTNSGRLSRMKDHNVTYVLRKKIKPIGLYAKKIHLYLPQNKVWIGFDFVAGDLVKPFGKGLASDVFFRCDTKMTGEMDAKGTLEIKFEEDGGLQQIQKNYLALSQMKMPHLASEKGYIGEFLREEKSFRNESSKPNTGYFLKTRAMEKDGVLISNYSKIVGDIKFDPRGNRWRRKKDAPEFPAIVSFTYYFNPTPNDRNLEFDPSKNLFNNLDSVERVNEP